MYLIVNLPFYWVWLYHVLFWTTEYSEISVVKVFISETCDRTTSSQYTFLLHQFIWTHCGSIILIWQKKEYTDETLKFKDGTEHLEVLPPYQHDKGFKYTDVLEIKYPVKYPDYKPPLGDPLKLWLGNLHSFRYRQKLVYISTLLFGGGCFWSWYMSSKILFIFRLCYFLLCLAKIQGS